MLILCLAFFGGSCFASQKNTIPIKVLILPKFEIGSLSGDMPGEGQFYYERYLDGGEAYEIVGGFGDNRLYVKDGVALYLTGMGKTNAALSTMAVLSDDRFDFSDAYIISTGCAGSAKGTTVMGDVFIVTAAVDYDLGHHADIRDMEGDSVTTWFHDPDFDSSSCFMMNPELMDRVYELVKDVPVQTTEYTRNLMLKTFDQEEWAGRDPLVLRGTTVTGDNYWKGEYGHQNALLMVKSYGCPDPYEVTEMEDVAVAAAVSRMGMLDRLIIIRDSVNMDVFILGNSPERLWRIDEDEPESVTETEMETEAGPGKADPETEAGSKETAPETEAGSEEADPERADIFSIAMENNFNVGSVIIDAILEGNLP